MSASRRRAALGLAVVGAVAGVAVARSRPVRWATGEDPCGPDGLTLPDGRATKVPTDDGAELAVHLAGPDHAPTVVLAHCWTGRMELWGAVARILVADGHRVVLYDQRGHGRSTAGSSPFTVERAGDDLHQVLAALDVRDVVLAGHSMGGMTIQAFAARHPSAFAARARGIVMVATAAYNSRVRLPLAIADRVLGERSSERLARRGVKAYRRVVGVDAHRAHIEATREALLATSGAARAGFLASMSGIDYRASLARIAVPAHVLVGSRDRLTPPARARVLARAIPDARLEVLDGLGHMLPLEAPTAVTGAITEMSRGAAGGRAAVPAARG